MPGTGQALSCTSVSPALPVGGWMQAESCHVAPGLVLGTEKEGRWCVAAWEDRVPEGILSPCSLQGKMETRAHRGPQRVSASPGVREQSSASLCNLLGLSFLIGPRPVFCLPLGGQEGRQGGELAMGEWASSPLMPIRTGEGTRGPGAGVGTTLRCSQAQYS